MPLIKTGHVPDSIYTLAGSEFDHLSRHDFMRVGYNGKDSSARSYAFKSAAGKSDLVGAIKHLSEEGVEISDAHVDMYKTALRVAAKSMTKVFRKASCVGVAPKRPVHSAKMIEDVVVWVPHSAGNKSSEVIKIDDQHVWYPVAVKTIGHDFFVIFKIWSIGCFGDELDKLKIEDAKTIAIGISSLEAYSADLAAYMAKLTEIAYRDSDVERAYSDLIVAIRPKEALAKEAEKLAKRYESNSTFGMWG